MPRLQLLAPYESPETVQRRAQLYLLAFAAVCLGFQTNALTWDPGQFQQSAYFFALALIATLTGVLALVLRRRAAALLAATESAEADKQTLDSISKFRASRSPQIPAINLNALLPPVDAQPGRHVPVVTPTTKPAKAHDPWSKMLDDLPGEGQSPTRRNQRKNSK